jgi:hypothetical protein
MMDMSNQPKRWRIWCLWSDVSEILVDLGPEYGARDAEHACEIAAGRGLVSGYGLRPSYRGLIAIALVVL